MVCKTEVMWYSFVVDGHHITVSVSFIVGLQSHVCNCWNSCGIPGLLFNVKQVFCVNVDVVSGRPK